MIGAGLVRNFVGDINAIKVAVLATLAAVGGATLIGFAQTGDGAAPRTVQDKLREVQMTPQDFGAVGDGVADDTPAFVKARDAAGVGGHVAVPPGTYKLNNLALSVAGQQWDFARAATFRSASKLTVPAITVSGAGVAIDGGGCDNQAASTDTFAMVGCVHVTSDDVTISRGKYRAAVGPLIYGAGSNRLRVVDNDFSDAWYAAVFVQPVSANIEGVTIARNRVTNTAATTVYKYGINVHNDAAGLYSVAKVVVAQNQVTFPAASGQFPVAIEVYGGPSVPGTVSGASATGNTVTGGGIGISFSQVSDGAMTGNAVNGTFLYGLEAVNPYNVTVSGNTVKGSQRGVSVSAAGQGVTVSGNAIASTTTAGVYLSQVGQNAAVSGNSIKAATNHGIVLLQTQKFALVGNSLDGAGVGKKAILLDKSDKGSISANTGSNWTENGVLIFSDVAGALNQVAITGNTWFATANSLSVATQLSNGATIGRFVSYIGNMSDADTSYQRDYLDILNNRVHFAGGGTPEGAFSAGVGSTYERTDATAGARFYVKESGTGNTGWVAK